MYHFKTVQIKVFVVLPTARPTHCQCSHSGYNYFWPVGKTTNTLIYTVLKWYIDSNIFYSDHYNLWRQQVKKLIYIIKLKVHCQLKFIFLMAHGLQFIVGWSIVYFNWYIHFSCYYMNKFLGINRSHKR